MEWKWCVVNKEYAPLTMKAGWSAKLFVAVGNLFRTKDRNGRKNGRAGQLLQAGRTRYKYEKRAT